MFKGITKDNSEESEKICNCKIICSLTFSNTYDNVNIQNHVCTLFKALVVSDVWFNSTPIFHYSYEYIFEILITKKKIFINFQSL